LLIGKKFFIDSLARPYKTVETLSQSEALTTITNYDISGNVLSTIDPSDNTAFTHTYDMQQQVIKRIQMDTGTKRVFANVMGNPIKQWENNTTLITTAYDTLHRMTSAAVTEGAVTRTFRTIVYGETQTNPELKNLRTRIYQDRDESGEITETSPAKSNSPDTISKATT